MIQLKLLLLALVLTTCSASLSEPWNEGEEEEEWARTSIDYVTGSIWPKPQSYNASGKVYTLTSSEFSFDSAGETSDVLKEAFTRYRDLVFPDRREKPKAGLPQITLLSVKVEEKYEPLSLESDESYTLVVEAPSSSLDAKTVWGALRGLETFSQVVHQDLDGLYLANGSTIIDHPRFHHRGFMIDTARHYLEPSIILKFIDAMSYNKFNVLHWHVVDDQSFPFVSESFPQLSGQYLANGSTIIDHPRFHHRGFMIDTARHYLEPSIILKFIDAMSYNKFNVLHWHVVDDQSFPFVSESFPQLSGQGAYNNKTHIYTKENVSAIVEYGRLRGIRVVPEFDTPGHTKSWGSIENLLTPCYSKGQPSGTYGPINPTLDSTFTFLKKFFSEVAEKFPDKYLHLGGDEVHASCWASNPNITAWMEKMGYGQNYSLLEQHYEQNLLSIVQGLGKSYIVWQEVVDNDIKVLPDTVVNIWKSNWHAETARVTSKGLRTILSACWYLNHIHYGSDWPQYYSCEPTDFTGTDKQKELVIGGTGCMWGEYVDGDNILPRTWPRAFAIGERLWSSKETTDIDDASMRLWEHRCRYVRRGIPAENGVRVSKISYCRHEWQFK